jgi:hypothetical protein
MSDAIRPADMHEAPGVSTRLVLIATAGLLGLIGLAILLVALLFWASGTSPHRPKQPPALETDGAPALQVDPAADLAALKTRDMLRLHAAAAIPIDAAMRQVAARPDPTAPIGEGSR